MYEYLSLDESIQEDFSKLGEALGLDVYSKKTLYKNNHNSGFHFIMNGINMEIYARQDNNLTLINKFDISKSIKMFYNKYENDCIFGFGSDVTCALFAGYALAKNLKNNVTFLVYFYIIGNKLTIIHSETGIILYSQNLPNRSKTNQSGECKLKPFIISMYNLYFDNLYILDIFKSCNKVEFSSFKTSKGEYDYCRTSADTTAALAFRYKRS